MLKNSGSNKFRLYFSKNKKFLPLLSFAHLITV